MRIGILGGTFDPIHYGHLEMANRVQQFFHCDQLCLMPAYSPPHKAISSISSSYHRYAMAVLASNPFERIAVSRLELEAPARPFTVQTIFELRKSFGNQAQLFFIMGADSFRELDTWHQFAKLIASCHIVVITRPGYQLQLDERRAALQANIVDLRGQLELSMAIGNDATIFITDLLSMEVSATEIRSALAAGHPISQWVPPAVADYIAKYRLYQDTNETNN